MKEVQWIDPDFLAPKDAWDRLSMKEKAAMMKVAVQNGITNLSDIRAKYNEFAKGGDTKKPYVYYKDKEGNLIDYPYSDYESAVNAANRWRDLKENGHPYYLEPQNILPEVTVTGYRPIELKTYYPLGKEYPLTGHSELYIPLTDDAADNYELRTHEDVANGKSLALDIDKLSTAKDYNLLLNNCADSTLEYLNKMFGTSESPAFFTTPGDVRDFAVDTLHGRITDKDGVETVIIPRNKRNADELSKRAIELWNKNPDEGNGFIDYQYSLGGPIVGAANTFGGGGYKPSASVKKRISTWEGPAMTGAKDPLSGKWGKNRSFEAEASSFYAALPTSIRKQVLSNPELADNLFSYSYNVGAGNFKKRVVPALEKYYSGIGSAEEIASSMWASGDKKLRGLRNRRAVERSGVLNALTPSIPADNTFVYNPYLLQEQNTTMLPQVVPDEDAYVSTHEVSPEEIKAQKLQESFDNINRFNRTMEMLGSSLRIPTFHPTTGNDVLDLLWTTRGNDSPLLQMADEYAKGGGIHIKPSHRGRLTELKKRTGKTEAELYRTGSPAVRKMITFARNSRKWKHGLGGNLYDGTTEPSQRMNIGLNTTNGWQPYTLGNIIANGERVAQQRKALQDTFLNFPVESNDATAVANGRPQNTHLEGRAVRGGMDNAAWEKKHPGLAQLGYAASAVPFAVASAPILGAAAETGAGQAITTGLGWLGDAAVSSPLFTNAASRALGTSTLLPWLDAGMTAGFGAHGIQETAEGNFTPMTIVDLAPLGIRTGIEGINNLGKLRKYSRLEKNYTGVPHKQTDGTSIYMDEAFPGVHNEHTVWTSDDTDYAKMFALTRDKKGGVIRDSNGNAVFGKVFDVYTDPKELSVLQTPKTPDGQMVYWQGLPYKLKDGKVEFADITDIKENVIPKTKEIALNNRSENGWYDFDDTGHYIWKDGEGNLVMPDWKEVPGAISTDKVIQHSKDNGYQATRFNKVYDGGVTLNDKAGFSFDYDLGKYYDYPINELVLNPNAPKYILHHGTPKHKVFKQLPNIFEQPQTPFGLLPLITHSNDKGR